MRGASALVVGAGVGGLVTALELAREGLAVTVLERGPGPGGKMRREVVGGRDLDAGPTVLTMRWVFDEILGRAGKNLESLVHVETAETLARHWWPNGSRLDLFADAERSREAVAEFAGAEEARGFERFREAASSIYRVLEPTFIEATKPSLPRLVARVGLRGLPQLASIKPFASMWGELGRYFRDYRLRQLFGRYATYCGSSPFLAPATLMLVAHVESEGVWLVREGMHGLATALARTAEENGVTFNYGAEVAQIQREHPRGAVSGVTLTSGQHLPASIVVWNGDSAALSACLAPQAGAGDAARAARKRSLSAVILGTVVPSADFPLDRHNVFFSEDYAAEFDDIFVRGRLPASPTVYVCAQDRPQRSAGLSDSTRTERLLCIANAPAAGQKFSPQSPEVEACRTSIIERLAAVGLKLSPQPETTLMRAPADYERLFPATGGAIYGAASHGWLASFLRPGSRSSVPNLYLAGGSVHPGPGVPMAAISGRLAAQAVVQDLISAGRWSPVAIPGGISTGRARTAAARSP